MRWVPLVLWAACLSACGGEVYRGVFLPDGGSGEPVPDRPTAPGAPAPHRGDAGVPGSGSSTYELIASSEVDFSGFQGENGWRYGYIRPELHLPQGRGDSLPIAGGDARPRGTDPSHQSAFVAFPRFADVVPFQDGAEWVPFDEMRWLYVGAVYVQPHGPIGQLGIGKRELWVARRYVPELTGELLFRVRAKLAPRVVPCPESDGVVLELWRDEYPVLLERLQLGQDGSAAELRFGRFLFVDPTTPVDLVVKSARNDICDVVELRVDVLRKRMLR